MYNFRVKERIDPGLIQGDKTGIVQRNKFLQEVALVRAVAESSGKVFYNDAVDAAAFHIANHTLKVPPLQVGCTAGPIVNIGINDFV
jgi:hypothetical protein